MGDVLPRPAEPTFEAVRRLLERCTEGDPAALDLLYRRYRPDLYQMCVSRLRDPDAAEDIVQETFVRAITSISRFDLDRHPWPWLRTIGDRMCTTFLHRNRRLYTSDQLSRESAGAHDGGSDDATFDEVSKQELRIKLQAALKALPPRQRTILLLHLLEGWSYSEIAEAEGLSIPALKSIIFRARASFRRAYDGATGEFLLPLAFVKLFRRTPVTGLRARFARFKSTLDAGGLSASTFTCLQNLVLGISILVGAALPTSAPAHVAAADYQTPVAPTPAEHANGGRLAQDRAYAAATGTADGDAITQFISPSSNATPENSSITTIVASPDYAHDHTVFAAGVRTGARPVLFVSHDGGGTWTALPGPSMPTIKLLLSPQFSTDRRIFSLSRVGAVQAVLEKSTDGGKTFGVVAQIPLAGTSADAAISPDYAHDGRILVASGGVFDFRDPSVDTSVANQVQPLPAASQIVGMASSVAFGPSYLNDQAVMLGGQNRSDPRDLQRTIVSLCHGSVCSTALTTRYDIFFDPARAGGLFARTSIHLYRSVGDGATFDDVSPALRAGATISDTAAYGPAHVVAVAVAGPLHTPAIYLSSDDGAHWRSLTITVAGFERGAHAVVVTPTGQLIASAPNAFACSVDGGTTWTPRCTSLTGTLAH